MVTAEETTNAIYRYLRSHKKFPNVWCPGCGIGNVLGAIIRAADRMDLNRDEVAMVSGIGCSSRMPVYVDFNTLHTTHGRALAFATGIKLAKPHMKVIVITGDGDAMAIGGNHFIHAARRNIDLTTIVVNNNIYGLTGGQASPTTPQNAHATTATYGAMEQPFDICKMAEAAGSTFVARGTVYHIVELSRLIEQAINKKGFSVVEVISHCHTGYGRQNETPLATEMLKQQRDNTITVSAVQKGKDPEGKTIRGVFVDREAPEFVDLYFEKIVGQAQQEAGRSK